MDAFAGSQRVLRSPPLTRDQVWSLCRAVSCCRLCLRLPMGCMSPPGLQSGGSGAAAQSAAQMKAPIIPISRNGLTLNGRRTYAEVGVLRLPRLCLHPPCHRQLCQPPPPPYPHSLLRETGQTHPQSTPGTRNLEAGCPDSHRVGMGWFGPSPA